MTHVRHRGRQPAPRRSSRPPTPASRWSWSPPTGRASLRGTGANQTTEQVRMFGEMADVPRRRSGARRPAAAPPGRGRRRGRRVPRARRRGGPARAVRCRRWAACAPQRPARCRRWSPGRHRPATAAGAPRAGVSCRRVRTRCPARRSPLGPAHRRGRRRRRRPAGAGARPSQARLAAAGRARRAGRAPAPNALRCYRLLLDGPRWAGEVAARRGRAATPRSARPVAALPRPRRRRRVDHPCLRAAAGPSVRSPSTGRCPPSRVEGRRRPGLAGALAGRGRPRSSRGLDAAAGCRGRADAARGRRRGEPQPYPRAGCCSSAPPARSVTST